MIKKFSRWHFVRLRVFKKSKTELVSFRSFKVMAINVHVCQIMQKVACVCMFYDLGTNFSLCLADGDTNTF